MFFLMEFVSFALVSLCFGIIGSYVPSLHWLLCLVNHLFQSLKPSVQFRSCLVFSRLGLVCVAPDKNYIVCLMLVMN